MEIDKRFVRKYLHHMAVDQLEFDYKNQGFNVRKEVLIGDYRADLVVEKEDEVIVIEVKAGKLNEERRRAIAYIGDYVKTQGNYKFLIVFANEPPEKEILIDEFQAVLYQALIDFMPDELVELATHVYLDEVDEINFDKVVIEYGTISVIGNARVDVNLEFGSGSDGFVSSDSFPLDFKVDFRYADNVKIEILEDPEFKVDTSSFYK